MSKRTLGFILITAAGGLFALYEIRKEVTTPLLEDLAVKSEPAVIDPSLDRTKFKSRMSVNVNDRRGKAPGPVALQGNQVEFRVIDGVAIAYGDQILGRIDEGEGLTGGIYDMPKTHIWEKAEIPYLINPDLVDPERVEKAVEYLRQNTRLQFVPYDNHYDAIVFESGGQHCYSYLGKVGGLQPIRLSPKCDQQAILHEIMHALGFIHEQSRPDREQFITILWDNIQPDFLHQFNLVPEALFEYEKDSPFDYHSIMLYEPNAFARRPDLMTIESKKIDQVDPVKNGLSVGDLSRISNLYRF